MNELYLDIIRKHSRPMEPMPTDVQAQLTKLSGIRAVLFDIYGTLLISGSGDIGVSAAEARDDAVVSAMVACGLPGGSVEAFAARADGGLFEQLKNSIEADHAQRRLAGVEFPEVDIVEIWKKAAEGMSPPLSAAEVGNLDCRRLAIEFEVRVNPVWPMPDLLDCVAALAAEGVVLGIISNAQFYTPLLFPALLDRSLEDLAFPEEMQYYSYRLGEAKPGDRLYRQAEAGLAERGIPPHETLYVGNDMLNDIMPAVRRGFRTALFAGDQRSLRLREQDPRVLQVAPDLIVNDLRPVVGCVVA